MEDSVGLAPLDGSGGLEPLDDSGVLEPLEGSGGMNSWVLVSRILGLCLHRSIKMLQMMVSFPMVVITLVPRLEIAGCSTRDAQAKMICKTL